MLLQCNSTCCTARQSRLIISRQDITLRIPDIEGGLSLICSAQIAKNYCFGDTITCRIITEVRDPALRSTAHAFEHVNVCNLSVNVPLNKRDPVLFALHEIANGIVEVLVFIDWRYCGFDILVKPGISWYNGIIYPGQLVIALLIGVSKLIHGQLPHR